jgi:hypothetical protein
MSRNVRVAVIVSAFGLWLVGTTWGMDRLLHHANAPGEQDAAQPVWPAESTLVRPTGNALVVFAHPLCPCTVATIEELDRLMARTGGRLAAIVAVYEPERGSAEWTRSLFARRAAKIPGVTVVSDVEGREALRFGAATSGDCFLYDARGSLVFRGGITISRGHQGDSPGRAAIESFVLEGKLEGTTTHVFGCSLRRS